MESKVVMAASKMAGVMMTAWLVPTVCLPPSTRSLLSFSCDLCLGCADLLVVTEAPGCPAASHLITNIEGLRPADVQGQPVPHLHHGVAVKLQGTHAEVFREEFVCLER